MILCGCCRQAEALYCDQEYQGVCQDCAFLLARERDLEQEERNIEHAQELAALDRADYSSF